MNQVHDKIAGEVPFDAVSNQINETITRYLDGKDTSLVGGQVSNNKDDDAIDRFYQRLKSDITEVDESRLKEKKIGTEIGGYIVNSDNDLIPKAMESASPIKDISGIEKIKEEIGTNRLLVDDLNNEVFETYATKIKKEIEIKISVLKNIMEKFLNRIAITSNYKISPPKGNRNDYMVIRLDNADKKVFIPSSYSSFKEFLREGVSTFTLSDDDFYNRYSLKILFITNSFKENNKRIREMFKASIENNNFFTLMENIKTNNNALCTEFYNSINDSDACSPTDILGIYTKPYAVDVVDVGVKPIESFGKPADIDIRSLKFYMSKLNNAWTKAAFLVDLDSVVSMKEIKSKIKNHQPKLLKDIVDYKWENKSMRSVLDDITVGEFYDISARLIDVGYNTKNLAEKTMKDCVKYISSSCDSLLKLSADTLADLNFYKNKYLDDTPDRFLAVLHHIRVNLLIDSLNVLSILYALVAFDIYPRLDLYNAFCQSISSIEKSMKSGE